MSAYPEPLDDAALTATWDTAWSSLGCPAPAGLQAALMAAWSESHRRYHDQTHLRECLALWAHWRGHCGNAGEVAIALWFHDAIYDPHSDTNERDSAAWATRSLVSAGAGTAAARRVHDLVMATRHGAEPVSAGVDVNVLLDIDLSILGSPPDRYERFERDVREEYAWVPEPQYRERRAQVLRGFLDRPRLYHCDAAFALLEGQACINLAAAVSRLAP